MATRRSFLAGALALPAAGVSGSAPAPKTPPVRYRVLGKTGLKVSELGFGCEAVSDVAVLRQALDMGITFFDTAHAYEGGNNERVLGAALGDRRKSIVLSSRSYGNDARRVQQDLDNSLVELKTDYLDIWYFGSKDAPVPDELLAVRDAAKKAGKIRFSGFSTHRPWLTLDFVTKNAFDVVMIPYSFAIGTARDPFKFGLTRKEELLEEYAKAGLGLVAMKVMAGGYRDARAPKDTLADIHQRPKAHVAALRWVLRIPQFHTTSVRMQDRDQLEENMEAMAGPFSDADATTLAAHLDRIRPLYCRMCYSCDGQCPQGLPVADVLRYLTYADGYRRFDIAYSRFQRLAPELKAVRCADCGSCAVRCPNGVAVRERLIAAQELLA